MRACAPQGASCCIFYLGNAFFETFPKIVFFQNLGGGFLPSQRAVPLRTRESNQGRPRRPLTGRPSHRCSLALDARHEVPLDVRMEVAQRTVGVKSCLV